jgi:hypothetical protein
MSLYKLLALPSQIGEKSSKKEIFISFYYYVLYCCWLRTFGGVFSLKHFYCNNFVVGKVKKEFFLEREK